MSEKLPAGAEHKFENIDTAEEQERLKSRLETSSEQSGESEAPLAELAKRAETQAISGKEVSVGEKEQPAQSPIGQQKDLKNAAFNRTMRRVRSQLPASERLFSKVVHNPTIDRISAIGAQTVARPSGVLGGGLAAALGSAFVLYYGKRYGFAYNYLLFIFLFAAGFIIGIVVELAARFLRRKKTSY